MTFLVANYILKVQVLVILFLNMPILSNPIPLRQIAAVTKSQRSLSRWTILSFRTQNALRARVSRSSQRSSVFTVQRRGWGQICCLCRSSSSEVFVTVTSLQPECSTVVIKFPPLLLRGCFRLSSVRWLRICPRRWPGMMCNPLQMGCLWSRCGI